ncbi:hypothetical protein PROFUN_13187 [Planoprotostelium fungivorum]|uniref:Fungal lipase-type domain-containing protein n=1 Tax=Planoprotostelium fungivorum TaxID=1890364 RepID=A0A2P6N4Z9_9EUKA|nr:hypothetical protein PROFUN_13187 [Planoprotostelium fungivorum]
MFDAPRPVSCSWRQANPIFRTLLRSFSANWQIISYRHPHYDSMKLPIIFYIVAAIVTAQVVREKRADDNEHFSIDRARPLLVLAYSTYCVNVKTWNCYWCKKSDDFRLTHSFKGLEESVYGYAGVTKQNQIVFAFRGTRIGQLKDLITDLNFFPTAPFHDAIAGALVHRGFLESYEAVRDQVVAAGIELSRKYPGSDFIVTGHSLGGAIATLGAADLAISAQVKNPVQLWTFGSPRVGNAAFASYMNDKYLDESFRITHDLDPIPRLPPKLFGDVQHVDREFWFRNSTDYQRCATEDENCNEGQWGINIVDHGAYLGENFWSAEAFAAGCVLSLGGSQ